MSLTQFLPPPDDGNPIVTCLRRVAKTLDALIETLAPFEPKTIYDQSGLTLEVLARRTGRDFAIGFPFQCFDAGDVAPDQKTLVYLHSHLSASIRCNDHIEITGLDFAFNVVLGDVIYLELTIDSLTVTQAAIKHGAQWANYPEPVLMTGDFPNRVQTKAFLLIAFAVAHDDAYPYDPPGVILGTGSAAIMLVNTCRNHLLMAQTCYQADTIIYPMPWNGSRIEH